jgi:mannitol/fructose-specific phosphotransferase system IIA component (Ntr-type)
MALRFSELFNPQQVALDLRAANQNDAIIEISGLLRANRCIEELYPFADAVMQREARSSTNTGEGIAFPHARTDLVKCIVVGIGRSKAGVPFGGAAHPVHLVFVIGVPQLLVTDYLICVGTIARIVKPRERWEALMNAASAEEFADVMRAGALLLE